MRKIPFAGIELTSQRVRGLRGTSALPRRPVESTPNILSFRMVFFYLVTTGWIFFISLCESSIITKHIFLGCYQERLVNEVFANSYRWHPMFEMTIKHVLEFFIDIGINLRGTQYCISIQVSYLRGTTNASELMFCGLCARTVALPTESHC